MSAQQPPEPWETKGKKTKSSEPSIQKSPRTLSMQGLRTAHGKADGKSCITCHIHYTTYLVQLCHIWYTSLRGLTGPSFLWKNVKKHRAHHSFWSSVCCHLLLELWSENARNLRFECQSFAPHDVCLLNILANNVCPVLWSKLYTYFWTHRHWNWRVQWRGKGLTFYQGV